MLINKFIKSLVPPIFIKSYQYFKNLIILSIPIKNPVIFKNNNLKKFKKNNRAFLIATGPSLAQENLKLLKGEDCFTLSNAFLLNEINIIEPLLHFFAPHHYPITRKSFADWLKESDKILPTKTNIVMGYEDRSFKNQQIYKLREIFYLKISNKIDKFHINIQKPLPKFQTGSLMILPVLIYMGYKKIYLLGCDHNQLKNFNSSIKNFYKESKDLRYTKKKKINQSWLKLDKELNASLLVYKQYKEYNKIAKSRGVEIINLSKNSWLDLFKKEDLKKII